MHAAWRPSHQARCSTATCSVPFTTEAGTTNVLINQAGSGCLRKHQLHLAKARLHKYTEDTSAYLLKLHLISICMRI